MSGAIDLDRIVDLVTHEQRETINAIYLFGSYREGTAIPTSDIDIAVVTDAGDPTSLRDSWQARLDTAGIDNVDIVVMQSEELLRSGHYRIEHGSRLLFGEDIRPELPPTTVERYLRYYAAAPLSYIGPVLRRTDNPVNPLGYPDREGEFFGYDRELLPPNLTRHHNIKSMVSCACWIATMVVGIRTGRMMRSPAEGVRAHQDAVNDDWTSLITDIYHNGRQRWHYLVPAEPEDRALLRGLCERLLYLERYYLDFQDAELGKIAESHQVSSHLQSLARSRTRS